MPIVAKQQNAFAAVCKRQGELEGQERLPGPSGAFNKHALVFEESQQRGALVEGDLDNAVVLRIDLRASASHQTQLWHQGVAQSQELTRGKMCLPARPRLERLLDFSGKRRDAKCVNQDARV